MMGARNVDWWSEKDSALGISCLTMKMIPMILSSEMLPEMRHAFTTFTQSQNAEQTMEAPWLTPS